MSLCVMPTGVTLAIVNIILIRVRVFTLCKSHHKSPKIWTKILNSVSLEALKLVYFLLLGKGHEFTYHISKNCEYSKWKCCDIWSSKHFQSFISRGIWIFRQLNKIRCAAWTNPFRPFLPSLNIHRAYINYELTFPIWTKIYLRKLINRNLNYNFFFQF